MEDVRDLHCARTMSMMLPPRHLCRMNPSTGFESRALQHLLHSKFLSEAGIYCLLSQPPESCKMEASPGYGIKPRSLAFARIRSAHASHSSRVMSAFLNMLPWSMRVQVGPAAFADA